MPMVRVTIHLPYLLVLPPGAYSTPSEGGSVSLAEVSVARPDGTSETRTAASTTFQAPTEFNAIDSTFVRKFKSMVDERLAEDWPEGRDFLKGIDFGLRHKMTTGLRFLAGRSLYQEPDGFWPDLSASYALRNGIIHEGQVANEDQAKLAIKVARQIVRIVSSLSGQATRPGATMG